MNNRINCLKADIYGQLLMLLPLSLLLVPGHQFYAFVTYFSVGIWQTLSCYITAIRHPKEESPGRFGYRMVLSWTLGIAVFGIFLAGFANLSHLPSWLKALSRLGQGLIMAVMVLAIFLSPMLAVWYFAICRGDLNRLREQAANPDAETNQENTNPEL